MRRFRVMRHGAALNNNEIQRQVPLSNDKGVFQHETASFLAE